MNRLALVIVLLCSACVASPAPSVIMPTLPPAYALQDAQATGTAAARAIESTATAQAVTVATEARASIALAEAQTQAAIPGMQTSTAAANAITIATATEGASYNATRIAATMTADLVAQERAAFEANARLVLTFLAIAPIIVIVSLALIRIGNAVVSKVNMASIVIVKNDNAAPVGFLMPGIRGPQYHSLTGGYPTLLEPEPDLDRQCRDAWRKAVADIARDAAEAGAWGVNTLSRGSGRWAEDTLVRAQAIAAEIGAIVNYGGSRGWDWAGDWDYIGFTEAVNSGVWFTLPRKANSPDGELGALLWPVLPEQSETKASKAAKVKAKQKQGAEV